LLSREATVTVFIVIVMVAAGLVSGFSYEMVREQAEGLRGWATAIANTLKDPTSPDDMGSLKFWIDQGVFQVQHLSNATWFSTTIDSIDLEKIRGYQANLDGCTAQTYFFAHLLYNMTQNRVLNEQNFAKSGYIIEGSSFEPLLPIVIELKDATEDLNLSYSNFVNAVNSFDRNNVQTLSALKIEVNDLANHYYQVQALNNAAGISVAAGDIEWYTSFILITVLYSTFLLFPGILLLLFFFRKLPQLIDRKSDILKKADLPSYEKYCDESQNSKPKRKPKISKTEKASYFINRIAFALRLSEKGPSRPAGGTMQDEESRKEDIRRRAFNQAEYMISLVLLTIVNGALFYFFFYPNATSGLAQLISEGSGVKLFADYLTRAATPITFGFIGAYFWVIQFLLRRYFAGDLNPRAYTSSVVRVLTVFVICVVLQVVTMAESFTQFPISVIAFVIGIFPNNGIDWILEKVNKSKYIRVPERIEKAPLTVLEGINTWHEARLLEENVENVQNLATVDLSKLVINTNFCAAQIFDWVDQALLYIHTQECWNCSFRLVGIRTATDLIDNTEKKNEGGTYECDKDRAQVLAEAINAAQPLLSSSAEKTCNEAVLAASELYKSAANVASFSEKTSALSKEIVDYKIENNDNILILKNKMQAIGTLVEKIKSEKRAEKIKEEATKLADVKDVLLVEKENKVDTIGSFIKKIIELYESANGLVGKLDRKDTQSLLKLEEANRSLSLLTKEVGNLVSEIDLTAEKVKPKLEDEKTKKEWAKFFSELTALQEESKDFQNKVKEINEKAILLDKDRPETLNKLLMLSNQLNTLVTASSEVLDKVKKAKKVAEGLLPPNPTLVNPCNSLEAAQKTVENLEKTAKEAKETAAKLDLDKPETMTNLSKTQTQIEKAIQVTTEAKNKSQKAAKDLQTTATPPKMTSEIIQTMANALRRSPNIQPLNNYWENLSTKTPKTVNEKQQLIDPSSL
jgi:hypothetical protein